LNPLRCGDRSAGAIERREQGHKLRWKPIDEALAPSDDENGLESLRVPGCWLAVLEDGPKVGHLLERKAVELCSLGVRKIPVGIVASGILGLRDVKVRQQ
jgi:hypothetical protein